MNEQNLVIIITGETGSGKSYLDRFILPNYPNIEIVSKYTTRKPRVDEGNVKDVRAGLSKEKIDAMDYTYVNPLNNESYGAQKSDIDDVLSRGKIPCVDLSSEKAYLEMLNDYPNALLILKIVPFFEEDTMQETFERQGRDPQEFESRKSALVSPLTEWVYKYDNMREIINPYFMRSCPDKISASIIARRFESIITSECNKNLGATLLDDEDNSKGLYHYLYYYSKNRPHDTELSIDFKGLK